MIGMTLALVVGLTSLAYAVDPGDCKITKDDDGGSTCNSPNAACTGTYDKKAHNCTDGNKGTGTSVECGCLP